MNILKRIFGKSTKPNIKEENTIKLSNGIDLSKIYPRIKAFIHEDPNESVIELSLEDGPIYKPFAEELGIFYMLDTGDNYQMVQNKNLSEEITIDKIHEKALTNLAIAISDKTNIDGDPSDVMMVTNGGNFEATMLLMDFLWEQLQPVFNDEICVAIPANDLLFISAKNNPVGRESLRRIIRLYFDDNQTQGLVSRNIYEYDKGRWELIETA